MEEHDNDEGTFRFSRGTIERRLNAADELLVEDEEEEEAVSGGGEMAVAAICNFSSATGVCFSLLRFHHIFG